MKAASDSALASYREAAHNHGAATLSGDSDRANRAAKNIRAMYLELARLNELERLRDLLVDDDPSVRSWAASHLLHTLPREAEPALRELAKRDDILGFNSSMALHEWKGGRLKPPT